MEGMGGAEGMGTWMVFIENPINLKKTFKSYILFPLSNLKEIILIAISHGNSRRTYYFSSVLW